MVNLSVLLLKSFEDVLTGSFQGKQYTYRIEPNTPCPTDSTRLWKSRGFEPSPIGTAFVTFQIINGIKKEYIFPAFFGLNNMAAREIILWVLLLFAEYGFGINSLNPKKVFLG